MNVHINKYYYLTFLGITKLSSFKNIILRVCSTIIIKLVELNYYTLYKIHYKLDYPKY